MLEGHLVRELLGASWQSLPGFQVHEIFHGLTAPGFLFGAGFTFAIATQRKAHLLRGFSRPVLRRIWRGVSLILIGYALHLPYLSLTKTLETATPAEWESFLLFDVLQLIGLCVVALRLLYVFFRKESAFLAATSVAGFLLVLGTPLVWDSAAVCNGP
ncbi:MAG: heparan-alpha-glucosaminide N-acetyltransferase domain-containing protein, partial [Bacteroidota bacterium]